MIQELCNIGNEHQIDTFFKIAIFEVSQLPYFNNLTSDETIENIITNIPDTSQVLIAELLPKNIRVDAGSKITDQGVVYTPNIAFTLTPQDKNLQALLEKYQNKEVITLISKRQTSYLYGTKAQPLLFEYDPIHSNDPSVLKGYAIKMYGEVLGAEKLFENITFNIYSRGLAFTLAQEL
jgi:hypothetical protein